MCSGIAECVFWYYRVYILLQGVCSGITECVFWYYRVYILLQGVCSGITECVFWYYRVYILIQGVCSGIAECVFWYYRVYILLQGVCSGITECVFWYYRVYILLQGVCSGITECVFWYYRVYILIQGVCSGITECVFWYYRVYIDDEDSVINYKLCTWTSLKIEGWSTVGENCRSQNQLRLIVGGTSIRIAFKRQVSSSALLCSRISMHLGWWARCPDMRLEVWSNLGLILLQCGCGWYLCNAGMADTSAVWVWLVPLQCKCG